MLVKDIIWDESLSVGVDEVDEYHRRLVDLYNLLHRAVAEGESADYIDALLEELISCTAWHFKHEERLMLKFGYDAFEDHKLEHRDLIDGVRALQEKFHSNNKLLTSGDFEYLSNWLTVHIVENDMRMGFFLMKLM